MTRFDLLDLRGNTPSYFPLLLANSSMRRAASFTPPYWWIDAANFRAAARCVGHFNTCLTFALNSTGSIALSPLGGGLNESTTTSGAKSRIADGRCRSCRAASLRRSIGRRRTLLRPMPGWPAQYPSQARAGASRACGTPVSPASSINCMGAGARDCAKTPTSWPPGQRGHAR